jgi:hypothetical protein
MADAVLAGSISEVLPRICGLSSTRGSASRSLS